MTKMSEETKAKVREASSGLKKLTKDQEKAILKLYETGDEKFKEVEKIVHKSVLYNLTKDIRFAPKANRNEKAEALNTILFS